MSDLTGSDERNERATNLTRDVERFGDSIGEAEIAKGIFCLITEIEKAEARALQSARPKLQRAAERYPESLLERQVRDIVYESLAETFLTFHKRSIDKLIRKRD